MSEDAYTGESARAAQVFDGGERILHEIFGGSSPYGLRTGGLSEAAVVVAQGGDAVTRKVVCNHEERPVSENLLVAILESASADHDYRHRRGIV